MSFVVQNAIDAMSLGSLYAILALGIGVIFGIMRLINFAHGDLIMVGAYLAFFAGFLPWLALVAVTLIMTTLIALGMDRAVFRQVRRADPTTLLVLSFGLSFLIQNSILITIGARPRGVALPVFLTEFVSVGGLRITKLSILTVSATAVLLFALVFFLKKTSQGLYMRAAAEDFEIARMLGVRANTVIATAFGISGVLAGVAAVLLVSQSAIVHPAMGTSPILIAFVATIIGGLGSLSGAVLGGFVLGCLTVSLQAALPLEFRPYRDAFAFGVVILILLVRPQGLIVTRASRSRV